ncbi:ABC transporter permease [Leisingera thetidis]|uniref:ABC transporter permease n=1 Tax=Leisingera thetidis TaxID=2930199 RepID=UPI0021F70011|nr:ABC transporter permease [Leisingera thetidis]
MMLTAIRYFYVLRPVWAVLLALFAGSGLILIAGVSPITAYAELFKGAFLDYWGLAGTLVKTSPILLAGLAVILPLRAGLLNIGAEGQIYMGGLFSAMAALLLPAMPPLILVPICVLAGALGGGLWGMIPGYLKAYHGMNEVILTILLNFIAINIVSYVAGGPMMQEGAPYPYSEEIRQELWLPWIMDGTDAHAGVVVGLALAMVMYFVLKYSTIGFALDTIGKNATAARYAGVPVRPYIVWVMFAAGALGGLAGTFEVLGLKYRLYHHFSPGYGFDGIVVAFLATVNPLVAPIAAFFLSGLKAGALVMQRAVGLESTVIEAIQGLVIIFVAASLGFKFNATRWSLFLQRRRKLDAEVGDTFATFRKGEE